MAGKFERMASNFGQVLKDHQKIGKRGPATFIAPQH
jgi:hypothetical protein